ncbi:hypothetical protein C0995_002223 [Termitomyces sp. Mi166|nr:hypothetical protein C0995_002223 [Termitomyces sp. Mi166\
MAEKPKSKVAYGTTQASRRLTLPTYITHSSTLVLVLTIPVQAYSNGLWELILGRAIKQLQLPREEIVILTKVYFTVARETGTNVFATGEKPEDVGYVNQHGLSRKVISLPSNYFTVVSKPENSSSTFLIPLKPPIRLRNAHRGDHYALTHNLTPFISMQNHHSVLYRETRARDVPHLKLFGVGSIPWSPLARGLLTRPMKEQTKRGETDRFLRQYLKAPGTSEIVRRVEELAHKESLSMAQIAVMWSLSKEGVTAPIVEDGSGLRK